LKFSDCLPEHLGVELLEERLMDRGGIAESLVSKVVIFTVES